MLAIIGSVGVPACYGGFESLVENLLDEKDKEVLVYCSSKSYKNRIERYKNARLIYLPIDANGVMSIAYDALSIADAIRRGCSTLLILGVSGCIILPLVKLFWPVKIIVNIDGLEWRRGKWKWVAKKYLKLSERVAVRSSTYVISDNEVISDYVKSEYGVASVVIPYGGDHAIQERGGLRSQGYVLALCRIEPENNCHMILESFKERSIKLVFVGNWQSSEYGNSLLRKYSGYSNICMIDPIYDINKLFQIRSECDLYIHGHSAGGTNPSLVEMMFFEKPIFCFDCDFNRATTENEAIYFEDSFSLGLLIDSYYDKECEFTTTALNLFEVAKRRYTWASVRKSYAQLFYGYSGKYDEL